MKADNKIGTSDKIIAAANSLENTTKEDVREKLILLINEMINTDFNALVQLLYRIDIDEKKLKHFLNENKAGDAAPIIASLIIERQLKKIETKKQFSDKERDDSDEAW